jgi:HEPN domain-containing protein
LTKQEHIKYWVETAEKDWDAVQGMYEVKTYLHALFFAHLVLEKLLKAHWVKDNEENFPPKIHNLLNVLAKTNVQLSDADKDFLATMNQFQLEGRYPDYKLELYKKYKSVKTKEILDEVNTIRKCLLKKL